MKRIVEFYFTGTDTTKNVVHRIGKNLKEELNLEEVDYDFSLPSSRNTPPKFTEDDLVIAGVPTIAGRVPNLLLPYLNTMEASGAKVVTIALYGNRNYDDCLMELSKIFEEHGGVVIAGGAFIGEHSFSKILGKNRPDDEDYKVIDEFSKKIVEKIKAQDFSKVIVGGEYPLRPYYTPRDRHGNGIDIRKVKPKTDMEKCTDCKLCAEICPMGAINYDNVEEVPGICMKCCACIKKCPVEAKYFDDEGYLYHARELEEVYARRAEPEYFV